MSRLLWIIIVLLWIIVLTLCWHFFICPDNAAAGPDGCDQISFNDGTALDYDGAGNIKFLKSSSNLVRTEAYLDNALATINNYLIKNKGRAVKITGHYESGESFNNTNFGNLGEARADQIRQLFLSNGIPANQISIAGKPYKAECMTGDTLRQGASFTFSASN